MILAFTAIRGFSSPTFDTSTPVSFFTNVADRLVASELNLNLTRLQVYPTNQYTPAVQRLLQVTANIYDATTTNRFPSVFRPLFSSDDHGATVFITGYQQIVSVTGIADSQLAAPADLSAFAFMQASFTNQAVNVYGVPWIIGARKGFPNFNQYYMRSTVQVTRKLQVTRQDGNTPGATGTNQMFVMSITNRLGFSFWNSYNSNYVSASGMSIYVRDIISMTLTNAGNSWSSFYANPAIVQFATNFNIGAGTPWPGSAWTSSGASPQDQTPSPQSFISGYWDFGFLPESEFSAAANNFVTVGNGVWDIAGGAVPVFPQFGLMTTNRLQAFILDGPHVIDYVQLGGPISSRDISEEIRDKTSNPAENTQIINGTSMWDTNSFTGGATPSKGVVNQIRVSMNGPLSGTIAAFWKRPPNMPAALNTPTLEASFFKGFFYGNATVYNGKTYLNTNLVMQAPYTPTRTAWEYISWQANDPLVHYLASDLNTITKLTGVQHADVLANSNYPNPNMNTTGEHYQPWGRNSQMSQIGLVDSSAYNLRLRDPLIWNSDGCDFPSGQPWHLNWLGRVHRGTPWQTIYLKSSDVLSESSFFGNIGTNTWMHWSGNFSPQDAESTSPVADWHLVSRLAAMLNTNDLPTQFSVNNPDQNAWLGLLNGLMALTNTADFPASYITPTFDGLIISSNSPQANTIAMAIESARASQPFHNLGDILAVAQLAEESPYLNSSDSSQQQYGISDEAYEMIPSQLLPLLRSDSFGLMTDTNGQMQVQFSGYDEHTYAIQVSADLVNWENISTNSPVNGTFILTLPQSVNSPQQFYRSVFLQ